MKAGRRYQRRETVDDHETCGEHGIRPVRCRLIDVRSERDKGLDSGAFFDPSRSGDEECLPGSFKTTSAYEPACVKLLYS